jgi:hypothetical protein
MQSSKGLINAYIQNIGAAKNDPTNLDAYVLQVNSLPTGTTNATEFLELIRDNFHFFMPSDVKFELFHFSQQNTWSSKNPTGAVMTFDKSLAAGGLIGDAASVLLSKYYSDVNGAYWNFTTLNTPWGDWGHPVSGTRQFGVTANTSSNGTTSYTFYIRGIDRVADGLTWMGGGLSSEGAFEKAHQTWLTVMSKIQAFVNKRGGSTGNSSFVSDRISWREVKKYYTGPSENSERFGGHVVK